MPCPHLKALLQEDLCLVSLTWLLVGCLILELGSITEEKFMTEREQQDGLFLVHPYSKDVVFQGPHVKSGVDLTPPSS